MYTPEFYEKSRRSRGIATLIMSLLALLLFNWIAGGIAEWMKNEGLDVWWLLLIARLIPFLLLWEPLRRGLAETFGKTVWMHLAKYKKPMGGGILDNGEKMRTFVKMTDGTSKRIFVYKYGDAGGRSISDLYYNEIAVYRLGWIAVADWENRRSAQVLQMEPEIYRAVMRKRNMG